MAVDPYAQFRPENLQPFSPGGGGGGGFSDWLRSLPTPQQLSPTSTFLTGRRGETGIGPNQVPAMWLNFAPYAANLINQGALAQRKSATAGSVNQRREFERSLLSSYQSQGLDPVFAQRQLAGARPQAGYQLQQQLGGIESGRLEDLFNLAGGVQNALAQSYAGDRQLNLEAYLASRARKASRGAAHSAMVSNILGSYLGASGEAAGAAYAGG